MHSSKKSPPSCTTFASPALGTLSFACHGNKGTQLHNCASDSLTSRWRFIAVGVIAAAALLFFASVHWTRWCFTVIRRRVSALACPTPPIIVGLAPAASALASAARLLNSSGSGCSRPWSSCISSPCARFPSVSSFPTAGRRRARLGSSTSSGLTHTLAELLEFWFSRWLHASTTKQRCVTRSHSRTREHFFNLTVIEEGRNFDAVWHSPVPTNKNSLQGNGLQTSSTYSGMLQFYCRCQTTPGWPRAWFFSRQQVTFSLSRKGTSLQHDRFCRLVLSRYWSFAVIVDFVCVFRSIWPQAQCRRHRIPRFRAPTLSSIKLFAFGS